MALHLFSSTLEPVIYSFHGTGSGIQPLLSCRSTVAGHRCLRHAGSVDYDTADRLALVHQVEGADSDEVARVFRDDVARDSGMMSLAVAR
jgi:hypothetical protein